ncbi:MAG: hypothetical protein VKM17_06205 [Cyanobacteriota bacterium]|nr:hypothetical protein [Cyanobacteriota bacterium]
MIDRSFRLAVPLLMALHLLTIAPAADARRPTLLQRLREWIGLNPRQAVGGSRGESATTVCLITPRLEASPKASAPASPPTALVNLPRPTLLAAGELNEIRLEENGRLLWQQRASSTTPISGQIPWPIAPLTPGQEVLLRLRPRGAAGADFATITLRAAPAAQQQTALALLADPSARLNTIESTARSGRSALASELVFAHLAKVPADLDTLRQELVSAGCSNSRR